MFVPTSGSSTCEHSLHGKKPRQRRVQENEVYLSKKIAIPHQLALQALCFMCCSESAFKAAGDVEDAEAGTFGLPRYSVLPMLQAAGLQVVSWNSAQGWIACGGRLSSARQTVRG